ncbi:hypothetical protein B0T25DRAFT_255446 [Lasiosphaeria hispida]|uniref:Uncharacterized protein n=1 Tax=Lasiosphaeria hispida TaxID=260671 RepID=A0AAJ0MCV0_9PEZI|nr:hypothetical protein B0T25DRAFT_255446 [Lasiosphaeria hispida]
MHALHAPPRLTHPWPQLGMLYWWYRQHRRGKRKNHAGPVQPRQKLESFCLGLSLSFRMSYFFSSRASLPPPPPHSTADCRKDSTRNSPSPPMLPTNWHQSYHLLDIWRGTNIQDEPKRPGWYLGTDTQSPGSDNRRATYDTWHGASQWHRTTRANSSLLLPFSLKGSMHLPIMCMQTGWDSGPGLNRLLAARKRPRGDEREDRERVRKEHLASCMA